MADPNPARDDGVRVGVPSPGVATATKFAAAVAAVGLVGTATFGLLWWSATHGTDVQIAEARDNALAAARKIAVNLQTLDYRTVNAGLDGWKASATGPLLAEFQRNGSQYAAQIAQARTTSTARLVGAGLSDLDATAGKATAIAALDISTVTANGGTPNPPAITKQVRIELALVRTPDGTWKAAAAGPIRP
jgi:Mce-associated membrane protein